MTGILAQFKKRFIGLFEDGEDKQIGIYGPPNGGKTTLTNKMARDWSDENDVGTSSEIPHETREVNTTEVEIEKGEQTVELKIADTPGVETHVSDEEFIEKGFEEDNAMRRASEATQGITEALEWLRSDIDGVLYVVDSTENPFQQVNTTITGIIESSENVNSVLVLANKIDKEDSDVEKVKQAFPQHDVLGMSAKEGDNIDEVYEEIVKKFG